MSSHSLVMAPSSPNSKPAEASTCRRSSDSEFWVRATRCRLAQAASSGLSSYVCSQQTIPQSAPKHAASHYRLAQLAPWASAITGPFQNV